MCLVWLGLIRIADACFRGVEGVGVMMPQVVQWSCNLGWQLWGFCVAVLFTAVFPLPSPVCEAYSVISKEVIAACGGLYQGVVKVNFQIVYKIILSDSRHCQRPSINPSGEESIAALSWAQASLLNQQRPTESIYTNQFCILLSCTQLIKTSRVWFKIYCFH